MRILQASACVLALCLAAPAEAQQFQTSRPPGMQIGAEAGIAFPIGDSANGLDTGFDFIGRLGYEMSIGLTPQIVAEYARWGFNINGMSGNAAALELMAGLRWSFLAGTWRPWGAFNIGLGHTFPGVDGVNGVDGLAYNVGGGVDFMITTSVGFGLRLVYNHISVSENNVDTSAQWLDLGAGLVVTF